MGRTQIKIDKPALLSSIVKMNLLAMPAKNSKGAGGIVMRMSQGDTAEAINDAYKALYEIETGLISTIKATKNLLLSAHDQFEMADETAANDIQSVS